MMEYFINNSVYGLFYMSSFPSPFSDLLIKPKLLKVNYITNKACCKICPYPHKRLAKSVIRSRIFGGHRVSTGNS